MLYLVCLLLTWLHCSIPYPWNWPYNICTDTTSSPKLWVALSDGRIKIYNAITWIQEKELDHPNKQSVCNVTFKYLLSTLYTSIINVAFVIHHCVRMLKFVFKNKLPLSLFLACQHKTKTKQISYMFLSTTVRAAM